MNFPEVLKSALNTIIDFDEDSADTKQRNDAAKAFQSLLSFDLDALSDEEKDAVKNFLSMVILSVKGFAKGMGIVDSVEEPKADEETPEDASEDEAKDESDEDKKDEDEAEKTDEGDVKDEASNEVGGEVEDTKNDTATNNIEGVEQDANKKNYYQNVERYLS